MLGGIGQQGDDQVLQRDDPDAQLFPLGAAVMGCIDADRCRAGPAFVLPPRQRERAGPNPFRGDGVDRWQSGIHAVTLAGKPCPVCSSPYSSATPKHRPCSSSTRRRLRCQGVETGNDVEQLFVDATLAQPVESGAEIREQLADIAIGTLHGGKTTRVFAGQ